MTTQQTVLLVGGAGRSGRRALEQLLDRGVNVRAVVRSGAKLAVDVVGNPNLSQSYEVSFPLRGDETSRSNDTTRYLQIASSLYVNLPEPSLLLLLALCGLPRSRRAFELH